MTVTPVEARCTRCRGQFLLADLLHDRTGNCPRCGRQLTDDWVSLLLDEARRADRAQQHLTASLRRLRELPGALRLLPHPVLRNVAESLGWEEPDDADDGLLDDQRKRLEEMAKAWPARATPKRPRRRGRRSTPASA